MKQYNVTLTGLSPLLMHGDNLSFSEKVKKWLNDPANREIKGSAGDDRGPAWTWIGGIYHDGHFLSMPSDNLMTCLREGGAKVLTGRKGGETFKKQTQSGILIDGFGFDLLVGGKKVPLEPINSLIGDNDFLHHTEVAESLGFELLVKRAKVGQAKHVRVRAMFRDWVAQGSITVIDEELSGLTQGVIEKILAQAGALLGLGDWRPGSPRSPGSFGRFQSEVKAV